MSIHGWFGRGAKVIHLGTLLLLLVWTLPASSGSKCKGLLTSQCQKNEACTWVSGYTNRQGKKVDPYCRQKASKSSRSGEKKDNKEQASSKSAKKSDKKDKADNKAKKGEKSKSDKQKAQKKSDKKKVQKSSKDKKE